MASIILSFVGQQDPYSNNTDQEGSISTLTKHLLSQQYQIRRVILLHSQDLDQNAKDTKDWLHTELGLNLEAIDTILVSEELSNDPVNLYLAVQEARKGLEQSRPFLSKQDRLEFNASSGTPVMKTAWSILQAAGYAIHSSVWQVRNPKTMKPGQSRVFQTNVDTVKNEFDLKVLERQIQNYNYSGALVTLETSNLLTDLIKALLEYGHYRLAFDFNRAFNAIQPVENYVDRQFIDDISQLQEKNQWVLFEEVYFKAVTKLKNQQYADFLIDVFRFQEGVLQYLVETKLGKEVTWPEDYNQTKKFWQQVKKLEDGQLYQHIKSLNQDGSEPKGFPSRYKMTEIIKYYQKSPELLSDLEKLNKYCQARNRIVHKFEGISELEDASKILKTMRQILQQEVKVPKENPFNLLNQTILDLLRKSLHE